MTIARRLTILVALPLIGMAGLGFFIRHQIAHIDEQTHFVVDQQIPSLAVAGNVSRCLDEMRLCLRTYLLEEAPGESSRILTRFRQREEELTRLLAYYGDHLISDDKDRRLYSEYKDAVGELSAECARPIALGEAGHWQEAKAAYLTGKVPGLGERATAILTEWRQHNEALAGGAREGWRRLRSYDRTEEIH